MDKDYRIERAEDYLEYVDDDYEYDFNTSLLIIRDLLEVIKELSDVVELLDTTQTQAGALPSQEEFEEALGESIELMSKVLSEKEEIKDELYKLLGIEPSDMEGVIFDIEPNNIQNKILPMFYSPSIENLSKQLTKILAQS